MMCVVMFAVVFVSKEIMTMQLWLLLLMLMFGLLLLLIVSVSRLLVWVLYVLFVWLCC